MTARAIDIVKRVQDRGIRFYAAFGLGFDEDEPALADRLLDYCARAGVITAEFFLATPFPNTPLYHQLAREGRLLHRDWGRYNGAHVVFRPKHFTPDALTETFLGLWRDFWIDKDVERSLSCFQSRRGAPSPAAPAD